MQINLISNPIWLIVKIFFLVGLTVYTIFAFVVVRQTQIMTNTVKLPLALPIQALALLHFLFAIGIFIFSFLVL